MRVDTAPEGEAIACESWSKYELKTPFVVGRRNWLFADTAAGANANANLYSLLQPCLANGIDGYRYLTELLVELPKAGTVGDFEALMPWRLAPADR